MAFGVNLKVLLSTVLEIVASEPVVESEWKFALNAQAFPGPSNAAHNPSHTSVIMFNADSSSQGLRATHTRVLW